MIYLLHGPNTVDLDDRIAELRREFDPSGFGVSVVDLAEDSLETLSSAVNATPFFGGQRIVLLKGANLSSGDRASSDRILEILSSAPPTTTIIIRQDSTIPSNSRLIKTVTSQNGTVEQYPLLRGRELLEWVIKRGQMAGVTVQQPAAQRLLERLYPTAWNPSSREMRYAPPLDMRLIATEVEKLATAAPGGEVGEVLVEELVADRSGYTAFKLNDDVYEGRTERALSELEQVMASGEQPERVLAQVAREGMALNATRQAREYDQKAVAIAAEISPGQLGFMLNNKSGWRNVDALRRSAEETRRAEWLVKTGRTQRTETVIVPLVGTIAETFKSSRGRNLRRSG